MIALLSENGKPAYGICEYVCDSADDVESLPKAPMGSTAFVIATGDVYMINSSKEWVKI